MAEYNNSTRAALERARRKAQNKKIKNLPEQEFELVTDLIGKGIYSDGVSNVMEEFQKMENIHPSQRLQDKEFVKVFIPEQYRESYFYIVDKLNRFPFSSGWQRRTVRSAKYRLSVRYAFSILVARLQEGVRQSICEAMDEGTTQAFLTLLEVIEKNNLIRYSSIKRAISTWIGIFDENNVDRISNKLLELMGQCLRDKAFCQEQLKTNDSIAISVALWALGFEEADDAIKAMAELVAHGSAGRSTIEEPLKPVLTDYYANRTEAEKFYGIFYNIYERLPKKGLIYDPCIFPWYRVELSRANVIRQLAFLAYVLEDEEKVTQAADLLPEMTGGIGRSNLIKLLLYQPKNQKQKEILIKAMGITEEYASKTAVSLVKKMVLEREDYQFMEDMLRFKRSELRMELLDILSGQTDNDMEGCLKRLLTDKREEKRTGGLDLLLRLSKQNEKAVYFQRVKPLASLIENPSDKEKVLISEILGEQQASAAEEKGFGFYDPDAVTEIIIPKVGKDTLKRCIALPEEVIIDKLQKPDALIDAHKDDEYRAAWGEKQLIGNSFDRIKYGDTFKLENYPLEKELRDFYEKEIGDYGVFLEMENRMFWDSSDKYENSDLFYKTVFGKMPFALKPLNIKYASQLKQIRWIYHKGFMDRKLMFDIGIEGVCALLPVLTKENHIVL